MIQHVPAEKKKYDRKSIRQQDHRILIPENVAAIPVFYENLPYRIAAMTVISGDKYTIVANATHSQDSISFSVARERSRILLGRVQDDSICFIASDKDAVKDPEVDFLAAELLMLENQEAA